MVAGRVQSFHNLHEGIVDSMNEETAYQQALDYLYSFIDYSLTRQFRYAPEKFDLSRMGALLAGLGDPQKQYRILHVAGTKGKGSVAAMTASALKAAGYKTGFYSSPHLVDYTERIQIDGQNIPHGELAVLVEEIKPVVAKIPALTTFELTTAVAVLYFARQQVEVAAVEVGLGGRLDATNVVEPLVSVITSISYDHTAVLGNTLTQIATEKAGIIKPGKPVIVAPQKEEARLAIAKIAAERGAPLTQVGRDYLYAAWSHSLDGQTLLVWPAAEQSLVDEFIETGGRADWEPVRLSIPLLGFHQVQNAATAYAALQIARGQGLAISEEAIAQGFAATQWPGRFEVMRRNPPVIVDSAHNRDSALKLRLALDDYLPGLPVILVFGASEDKDVAGMFAELLPRVKRVIATQSIHPRAMEAEKLVDLAHQAGVPAQVVLPLEDALIRALELADDEAVVLVAGSLFVAAGARETFLQMVNNQIDL
jgi:dihydrofolate synthase/folylpolyglutamate synthase